MHQGAKLKYYVDRQKLTNEEIARLAGVSEATLYSYFNKEEINSIKLKKIAKVLNIDYKEFEENETVVKEPEPSYTTKLIEQLNKQIELLEQQVADKNEIIELLKSRKR